MRNLVSKFLQKLGLLLPPRRWGSDGITDFFEKARINAFATYEIFGQGTFRRLVDINAIYDDLLHQPYDEALLVPMLLFARTQSSFLAGSHLTINTQIPDAYNLMRSVLENALYGYHMHKYPSLVNVWLDRNKDGHTLSACKNAFKVGSIWDELKKDDKMLCAEIKWMYDEAIDSGAHPNANSVLDNLNIRHEGNNFIFDLIYLSKDRETIKGALVDCLKCGIFSLRLMKLVVPPRFTEDIEKRLNHAAGGLPNR